MDASAGLQDGTILLDLTADNHVVKAFSIDVDEFQRKKIVLAYPVDLGADLSCGEGQCRRV